MKTLEDAFHGLLNYLAARPNGGSRAELIALAALNGFEEPLLNQWLDVFLAGFVDSGRIVAPDYDANFVPLVVTLGPTKTVVAVTQVFEFLNRDGRRLDEVRRQDKIAELTELIQALADALSRVAGVRDNIADALVNPTTRVAVLDFLDFATARRTVQRQGLISARASLQAG